MVRIERHHDDWAGIALAGAFGLGAGLVLGLVAGELLGTVDAERLRRIATRLRRPAPERGARDPVGLQQQIETVLEQNPTTRRLSLAVRALGEGIVELTGTAPDVMARTLAADLARGVAGADVVVNRILVEGTDVPVSESSPPGAR